MKTTAEILSILNRDATALTENDIALVLDPAAPEDMKADVVLKMERIVANYQAVLYRGDIDSLRKLLKVAAE